MKAIGTEKQIGGALIVFTGAILFSAKAVLIKIAYQYGIDSLSLLLLRMVFSVPFFILTAILSSRRSEEKITKKDWGWILFLGLIGYYLASYFDFEGLNYVSAGLERLILFIYPTIVVVFSAFLFGNKVGKKEIISLLLTYSGIAFAVINDFHVSQEKEKIILGGILIFGSAVTYAGYLIGSGKLIPKIGAVRYTSYAMIISSLAVIIHFILTNNINIFGYRWEVYTIGVVMAIFCTVIPGFLISEGLRIIGSGRSAIIGSIGPVSTIILAAIFLNEEITWWQITGTAMVLAGVLLVSKKD